MSDELLEQFIIESRELVQQAFDELSAIEREGGDPARPDRIDRLDRAFRAVHTLKGSAGLFDVAPLGAALHAAEDLMSALRDGSQDASPAALAALLDCIGATDRWIEAIAATGRLPPGAEASAAALVAALRGALGTEVATALAAPAGEPDWMRALLAEHPVAGSRTAVRYVPSADCFFLGDDPVALVQAMPELLALRIGGREEWSAEGFDPFRCNLVIEALSGAAAERVRDVFRLVGDQAAIVPVPAEADAPADPGPAAEAGPRTLRIDAGRIDALADLVGKLFVAKNRLSHLAAEAAVAAPGLARALAANQAEIERLAGDMHRAVMAVRMMPLGQTLRRLPLLVREIAGKLGKEVRLSIDGAATEADKTVVDALFEPLLHVLRNAVDHGIELPAARVAAGKPAEGQITLAAAREGEQVVITVVDDGAGIDPAALRRVAGRRGLVAAAALEAMDDAAALDLVFMPGFSTAAAVTDVSGRGVGMDAVRAALHAVGGRVGIAGSPGAGTTVRFVVPQAVAVTPVLVVAVGGERFGVPLEVILELARVPRAAIRPVRAGAAFVLRDRTVPVLRLADLLGRPAITSAVEAKILVIASGEQRVGVEVEGVGQRLEVVVRPLRGLLSGLPGVRGASLLGDGRVLLVLDLPELVG
ncbi:MAG: hypothetical protein NVSMB18_32100 [Acetobacteraceae bacterium]